MAQIAKCILESGLLTWRTDAPFDYTLMRIQMRRQAQQLDQMLGRFVVVIVGVVFDNKPHNMVDFFWYQMEF